MSNVARSGFLISVLAIVACGGRVSVDPSAATVPDLTGTSAGGAGGASGASASSQGGAPAADCSLGSPCTATACPYCMVCEHGVWSLMTDCSPPPSWVSQGAGGSAGGKGGAPSAGGASSGGGGVSGEGPGGAAGAGGAAACVPALGGAAYPIVVTLPDGAVHHCTASAQPVVVVHVVGRVVPSSAPDELSVDTCPPDAGCAPAIARVSLEGTPLATALLPGSLVDVTATFNDHSFGFGCTSVAVIHNLPSFGGITSPLGASTYLLAEVGDGIMDGHTTLSELGVDRVSIGCAWTTSNPACKGEAESYRLEFGPPGGAKLSLGPGETGSATFLGTSYQIKNGRSSYDGCTDSYWDYSYWAKAAALP